MRSRIALVLILLIVPAVGFGQSTLNFPRLFPASEISTSGLAVVNATSTTATVTFTLRSAAGQQIGMKAFDYAPGTQLARSADQVFGASAGAGWVQVTSATTGLKG